MQSRCKVIRLPMTTELFFSIASYQMPQGDRQIHRAELLGAISAWYGNVDRKAPMSAALRSRLVTLVIHSDTWHICDIWRPVTSVDFLGAHGSPWEPKFLLHNSRIQTCPLCSERLWPEASRTCDSSLTFEKKLGKIHEIPESMESYKLEPACLFNSQIFHVKYIHTYNYRMIIYWYTSYYTYCVYTMLTGHNFTTDMIHWRYIE